MLNDLAPVAPGHQGLTVADVMRMLEAGILSADDKFEVIDGEISPMSPQGLPHALIKSRLMRWFNRADLPSDLEVLCESTIAWEPRNLAEPDIALIKRQSFRPGFAALSEVRLAIEVSDTSLQRDLLKAREYAAGGLEELWIIDLQARQTRRFATVDGVWQEGVAVGFEAPLSPACALHLSLRIADLEAAG